MSTVTDPETMEQLINDCSQLPASLDAKPAVVLPRSAPSWEVDEDCQAQVADIDDYV